MTPYSAEYCENKIREYKNYIKEQSFKDISISYGEVKKVTDGYIYKRRKQLKESPIELKIKDKLIMEISVREVQGCFEAIKKAKGRCGVLGLGLGFYVEEISKKEEVTEILVYENNRDIIEVYKNNFKNNLKVKIIEGDGFKADRESFDFFFADIYSYEINENVAIDYGKLIELHDIDEYSFFGLEKFLLSCPMEELLWVYLPDEWLDMSKGTFNNVEKINQVKNIRKIKRNEASRVLVKFKEILN